MDFGAAILMAGLRGLLGRGPLARHKVNSGPSGFQIQYERIARNKTPAAVEVHLPPSGSADQPIRLRIQGDLVKGGRLRQIMPQPVRSDVLPDGMVVEFPAALSGGVVSFFRNQVHLDDSGTRLHSRAALRSNSFSSYFRNSYGHHH
jgi:hypothetical protein